MHTTSMPALRAHARGGAEQLVLDDVDTPEPRHDEVLVEVRAAGITFSELDWEETWTRNGRSRLPVIPAHEFSGTVAKIGLGVSAFHLQDDVFGMVPFDQDGAAAGFVRVPAANITVKPRGLPYITAAALPLAAMTAWQALVDHGRFRSGDRVLVHGGAGSVGSLIVQLARALGADVTATARPEDHDYVRALGARGVVTLDDFDGAGPVYDIVIDAIGGSVPQRSLGVLRSGGRLVCLTAPAPKPDRCDLTSEFFVVTAQPFVLAEIARLVVRGDISVGVSEVFPLDRGRAAYASRGDTSRPHGKTVIAMRGGHI